MLAIIILRLNALAHKFNLMYYDVICAFGMCVFASLTPPATAFYLSLLCNSIADFSGTRKRNRSQYDFVVSKIHLYLGRSGKRKIRRNQMNRNCEAEKKKRGNETSEQVNGNRKRNK